MKEINRRSFIKNSAFTGLASVLTTRSITSMVESDNLEEGSELFSPEHVIINITEKPSESIALTWRTKKNTIQYVQWCIASASPILADKVSEKEAKGIAQKIEDETSVTNYSVVVDGLNPNTQYLYRVGAENEWSEWFEFRTAGKQAEPFSFLFLGDVQNDIKSQCSRVIRKAYATNPNAGFLLYSGDLIEHSCSEKEWKEWFHAGGFIHASIPSLMTPGNHEYRGAALDTHWRPQFTLPENGPANDLCKETGFFVDYNDARIIAIDSLILEQNEEVKSATIKWLEHTLKNNTKKWIILTMHFPFYAAARADRYNPDIKETFQPMIEKYGVDLVLTGHDHAYGRGMEKIKSMSKPNAISGPMYVVSVCGPKQYPLAKENWTTRNGEHIQLFQVISIDNDVLNFKTYTATGMMYDEFDLKKREGKINKLVNKIPEFSES